MTNNTPQENPLFTSDIVYQLPYDGSVASDVAYGDGPHRRMDIYYPEACSSPVPAVILVTGFPDQGFKGITGRIQKEVGWYRSWARLLAASGVAAICYSNEDPAADVQQLIRFLRQQGPQLDIDSARLAVLASSSNGANCLALLQAEPTLRCAALCYAFTLDTGSSSHVADAAGLYRFRLADSDPRKFPAQIPLLLARAGREQTPGLNESMDLFVASALERNAPLTLLNYAEGEHCFDLLDDSAESVAAIKTILEFLVTNLG